MANYVRAESLGEYYDSTRRDVITPTRRKWLHRKMKQAELYGQEMPFTIGKTKKFGTQLRDIYVACPSCDRSIFINKNTSIVICTCGKMVNVDE